MLTRIKTWLTQLFRILSDWLAKKRFAPIAYLLTDMRERVQDMAGGKYGQQITTKKRGIIAVMVEDFNVMAETAEQIILSATNDRDRLSIVLSRMADGILVLGRDMRISLINTAAQRIFKTSESKAIGRSFIEAINDSIIYDILRRCLDSGFQQSAFVETYARQLYLGVVATPLQYNQGCILVVQNLTEIRRLEMIRRDFVANVSHELRTPVASIKALSETLNAGALEDLSVSGDFLQRIEVEVDKLAQMINELGELSNIESGNSSLIKKPTDIAVLIKKVANRMLAQLSRNELKLVVNTPEVLPEIKLDQERIERVLLNMIHNSIKFTPPGGQITISATVKADSVEVNVADTGIGIEPDDIDRIFERFYKVDKAHSGSGTGLGLAIARHTVEAHGGIIWAESARGKGSTIYFSLPITD
ncbi:MAG: cell wall metabolism sensor histidine kinase WalK [Dehalococcoidia bacterium]|nr:cell wall metabolism sensor histidine kinase WalK [Dehalococcoidia bacterium]